MTGPLAIGDSSNLPQPLRPRSVLPVAAVQPRRSPHWMLDQLPVGMLDSDFFARFVSIFQAVGATLLEDADLVEHLADVTVTPMPLVRYLASWIGDETIDPAQTEQVQRRLVAGAAASLTWRGTAYGLRTFLELITGQGVQVVEGGGIWRDGEAPANTAWVTVRVADTGWMNETDFATVVRDEVPAHVRAELWVGDRLVWSSTQDPDGPKALPSSAGVLPTPREETS